MEIKLKLNKYKDGENINKLIRGLSKIEIENVVVELNEDSDKVTCEFKLKDKHLIPTLTINENILNDKTKITDEALVFPIGAIKEKLEKSFN